MISLGEHSTLEGVDLPQEDVSFLYAKHRKHIRIELVNGKWRLRSNSHVGLIKLPSGRQIVIKPKITITNLLYIVSYTYDLIDLKYQDSKEITENDALLEIYAIVLLNWIEMLFKKGLYKTYIDKNGPLERVKGKIVISNNLNSTARLWCEYDELSHSSIENRIINAFLHYMLRLDLTKSTNQRILAYVRLMSDVEAVNLSTDLFRTVKYNRLNSNYRIIIELCALIYSNLFLKDEGARVSFSGFVADMNMVFQRFILNILKRHLHSEKVKSSQMSDWANSYQGDNFLPLIEPDILVEKRLVLDTKYYRSPLNDREKLHSNNLYQILTYMHAYGLNGILVYPESESELALTYQFAGLDFSVITFPLGVDIQKMEEAIDRFVEDIKTHFSHLEMVQFVI